MARRILWHSIAGVVLLVLLATLGTLQYRWLGEVSQAERDRMRTTLRTKLSDFSEAFDRELTRIYAAFHVDHVQLDAHPASALADTRSRWESAAQSPGLVAGLYLIEQGAAATLTLKRLNPAGPTLDPIDWPPELEQWRRGLRPSSPNAGGAPLFPPDAVDASIPALIISIPAVTRYDDGKVTMIERPGQAISVILVALNADRLKRDVLDPLVAKYFGAGAASEYLVSIVRTDDPARIVYSSDSQAIVDERGADATIGLFDLKLEELARLNLPAVFHREVGTSTAKMAITIVRRSAVDGAHLTMGSGLNQGAWQARVRFRGGSLDALVSRSRRRDLAISLSVLALLGASFVLIMASAARQRRLAQQQIEFVAAVSHELQTPLAVIRSAGENLADGVVAGDEHVKRYGSLIETEGRRLSEMVERVMTFAGIASGSTSRAHSEVDLAEVAERAVSSARAEGRDRNVHVTSRAAGPVPRILGDADGLRSALQNVLSNAVKYSRDGGSVELDLTSDGSWVRITVVDHGIGIDSDELPQIFRPFFRGRRAIEAQIRGTGIGLSVVRHVVDAHRGEIHIESSPAEGTTVRIALPAASGEEASEVAAVRSAHA